MPENVTMEHPRACDEEILSELNIYGVFINRPTSVVGPKADCCSRTTDSGNLKVREMSIYIFTDHT
jgi:hypothetical protein